MSGCGRGDTVMGMYGGGMHRQAIRSLALGLHLTSLTGLTVSADSDCTCTLLVSQISPHSIACIAYYYILPMLV